jgi:hypothetical protein
MNSILDVFINAIVMTLRVAFRNRRAAISHFEVISNLSDAQIFNYAVTITTAPRYTQEDFCNIQDLAMDAIEDVRKLFTFRMLISVLTVKDIILTSNSAVKRDLQEIWINDHIFRTPKYRNYFPILKNA